MVLAASLSSGQRASASWLWPNQPPVQRVQYYSHVLHPAAVAEMLYLRYGMARVLYVRPRGDVYYADALDRRGYRVSFAVDAYNGRVLESFIVGRHPAVPPVPPRAVARPSPNEAFERQDAPRSRRAMLPRDAVETAPDARRLDAPRRERPARATVSRQPPNAPVEREKASPVRQPPGMSASRPVTPSAPETPRPETPNLETPRLKAAPVLTGPPVAPARPALTSTPSPSPAASQSARQAGPVPRVPEPLLDPKTGRRNPASTISIPPALLDDPSPRRPAQASAPVPPAALE
jgi:hypothetical protein